VSEARPGLAEAFATALDVALPADVRAELAHVIEGFLTQAAARFAGVRIDANTYAAYLGAKIRQSGKPVKELDRLHGVDLYLALACAHGDKAAIAIFDASMIKKVPQYVRRADADVDEIAQRLREKLLVPKEKGALPRIADYLGAGPLEGFVRIAAVRSAISMRRAAGPWRFAGEAALDTMPAARPGPEADVAEAQQAAIVWRAFEAAAATLTHKQKQLLRFYHLEDTTLEKLAAIYDVHLSTVARWIEAARVQLRDATLAALQKAIPNAAPSSDELEAALDRALEKTLRQ
jgi:RNA polymerase sigma-70 factor (ECF subfamily)